MGVVEIVFAKPWQGAGGLGVGLGVGKVGDQKKLGWGGGGVDLGDEFDAVGGIELAVEGAVDQPQGFGVGDVGKVFVFVNTKHLGVGGDLLGKAGEAAAVETAVTDEGDVGEHVVGG